MNKRSLSVFLSLFLIFSSVVSANEKHLSSHEILEIYEEETFNKMTRFLENSKSSDSNLIKKLALLSSLTMLDAHFGFFLPGNALNSTTDIDLDLARNSILSVLSRFTVKDLNTLYVASAADLNQITFDGAVLPYKHAELIQTATLFSINIKCSKLL